MSFGNRSNFCSLKDAFRVPSFDVNNFSILQMPPVQVQQSLGQPPQFQSPQNPQLQQLQPLPLTQPYQSQGQVYQQQYTPVNTPCENCRNFSLFKGSFNEVLNIILILLLLYIIIYKPS